MKRGSGVSAMAKCLGAGLGKANAGLREASAPCGVWGVGCGNGSGVRCAEPQMT